MSSYISSFKALLAALITIGSIELAYSATDTSSPVERSSYLNWNFNSTELFHKVLIYEKLNNAVAAKPNVIQVGDSSGLHAIVPSIVDQYLGDLKYENLSCCANTGFDGYYTIADFMLRNTPAIKAIVLYMSWHNLPRVAMVTPTDDMRGDHIRSALGWPSIVAPPTLAARRAVLHAVYAPTPALDQAGLHPIAQSPAFAPLAQFLRGSDGWFPEHDMRFNPAAHQRWLDGLCQAVLARTDQPAVDYLRDAFLTPQSYLQVELRRFASLAARHNAKLIVMFQPFTCPAFSDSYLAKRQADLAAVAAEYPNVVVPQPAFEPWPSKWFTSADHLRTGHEEDASRRVGRAVAHALGLSSQEPPVRPTAQPVVAWSSTNFAAPPWQAAGLVVTPPQAAGAGYVAAETADAGWHRISAVIPELPARTYTFSVDFRTEGARQLRFEMMDSPTPQAYGYVRCDPKGLESNHTVSLLDSTIEELPDGAVRCSGKFRLAKPGASVVLTLVRGVHDLGAYQGDGSGKLVLYRFDISTSDSVDR